jgi:hypothetical protein
MSPIMKAKPRKRYGVGVRHRLGRGPPAISSAAARPLSGLVSLACFFVFSRSLWLAGNGASDGER